MTDCVFCRIVAGDAPAHVVREDEHTVAFLDINPATRGHTLVVPRRHARDVWDIERAEFERVAAAAWDLAATVRERLGAAGVNIVQSTGTAAWQTVFHLHIHVVPRYDAGELNLPWVPKPAEYGALAEVALDLTDTEREG